MRRLLIAAIAAGTFATMPTATVDAGGRCRQYEADLARFAPKGGWNIPKMSRTMWRESRCQSDVVNRRGGDTGLLQIHPVTWPWLSQHFGVTVTRTMLQNPQFNIQAAAALYTFSQCAGYSGYRPWRGGA
jgi:hypothetical protein